MSKLEEFENFLETIRKYSLLTPMVTVESKKPVIVLIDDIPITNGKMGLARLSRCLMALTYSTKVPIVILITQCHKTEIGNGSSWYWEELEALIERAGAHKVQFLCDYCLVTVFSSIDYLKEYFLSSLSDYVVTSGFEKLEFFLSRISIREFYINKL